MLSPQVLSDPVQRMVYDEINGYSLVSVNPFLDSSRPQDHVFVDEFSCIGKSKQWNYRYFYQYLKGSWIWKITLHVLMSYVLCKGCKNCANTAPKTFEIEESFGRARAVTQCGRISSVQQAIDTWLVSL